MTTDRIKKLRENSINAVNRFSAERALLITEFYKSNQAAEVSIPVCRALAFEHILKKKKIYIGDEELIVGERGPEPKATPSYPEISLHSLQDLEILDARLKVSFKVDEETKKAYQEVIIPYWNQKSNRDKIMKNMTPQWLDAYEAGVFTEFQEQRAPGHTVAGSKIFQKGLLDIIADIEVSRNNIDYFNDPQALEKQEELKAMEISARAIIMYAERHASEIKKIAESEQDECRKAELLQMAEICNHVPANAPRNFHEALQHYWFFHLGVITELNPWDSFNPGRLDQHLYSFYINETANESLTKDRAIELLQAFWIKFNNHPAPPKMGVTAKESNTYTDFALINLGGLTEDGKDAVNELTYVIMDVIQDIRLLQPSSMVQISKKNPDRFVKRTLEITKTGFGQPSIFNTDCIVQQLLRQGKSIEDARNGGASGCVETGAFGKESYILTGYFNLVKVLDITLHNGIDPQTGKRIGLETGSIEEFKSFDEVMSAYEMQIKHFIDIKIRGNNVIEKLFATYLPAPFLSLIIDDCVGKAVDYNAGGARYNTSYIQGVGLGSITDILTSIKYHVFDSGNLSLKELVIATDGNFENNEELRKELVYKTPKYGNDDDYADEQAVDVFEMFYQAVNGRPSSKGGVFRINMLPTTSHVYFGSVVGATADGRKAFVPLSEGISPFQGCDVNGPTAVLKSAAKIDHIKTGGTLLNQKFTPDFFKSDESLNKLSKLIRSYFRMDGHHIQFNVVSVETLRDAQIYPEKHRDLIVRVAGYSDYFNDLTEELQNEIIRRTEHQAL
ncbi:MAG: glycyl radical protein [Bacteroidales bacterium]|nr:glycyl radical protein [Bacteroidales bacterium]